MKVTKKDGCASDTNITQMKERKKKKNQMNPPLVFPDEIECSLLLFPLIVNCCPSCNCPCMTLVFFCYLAFFVRVV